METLSDEEIGQDLCKLLEIVLKRKLPKLRSINVTRWFSNPYQRGTYSYRSPQTDRAGLEIQVI